MAIKSGKFLLLACVIVVAPFTALCDEELSDRYWTHTEVFGKLGDHSNIKRAVRIDSIPNVFKNIYRQDLINVYSIDLNSDGKNDYIVQFGDGYCFFDSKIDDADGRVEEQSKAKKYCVHDQMSAGAYDYSLFVQMDNDPMLEIINLYGYEDGGDITFITLDPATWAPVKSIGFEPYVVDLCGEPRKTSSDIFSAVNLHQKNGSGTLKLLAAILPAKDNAYDNPNYPPRPLNIVFESNTELCTTNPSWQKENAPNFEYMTLNQIIKKMNPFEKQIKLNR